MTTLDTRTKILDSALSLFAQNGIDQTSTNGIAAQAGVAAGTIFVHFKTKQELINSVFLSTKQKMFQAMIDSIDEQKEYRQNFVNSIRSLILFCLTHDDIFRFHSIIDRGIDIDTETVDQSMEFVRPIVRHFDEGIAEGIIKDLPHQLLFRWVWSNASEVVHYLKETHQTDIPDSLIQPIWDMIEV
jgi:AcrR family transcriptional regulator